MIDLTWLAETGPCKKFIGGQRIPCPGGPAPSDRAMYILLAGRVDIFRISAAGGTQPAGSLMPGDVFGGREYFTDFDGCVYTAGIESVVYVLSEASFNDLSWSQPDILFDILKAAYTPTTRKPVPSQKTVRDLAMVKSAEKQKSMAELQVKGKQKTSDMQETISTLTSQIGADVLPFGETGIYPPGHKFYPGILKPEYAKLVFHKEYECPFCKKTFTDYRVSRSKLYEAAPVRYDLRRYYTDFQTEWFDVITCQHCLFSTFHNYYTEPKPLKKEIIENALAVARASIHIDFEAERDLDFVFTTHFLALICADGYLSAGKPIRARLWGNLSWLYEDVEDDEMAKFSAEKAAEAYEAIYSGTPLTPIQEQATCLSIAGMQFRAGVDRNMKKYLFTAKTIKMGDRSYTKLAEDFMYEIREDDKE